MLLSRNSFDLLKNKYVHELANQESHEATCNDPHALPEDSTESGLHIWNTLIRLRGDPPVSGWCTHGCKEHDKRIRDQDDGGITDTFNRFWAVIFINDI